MKSIIKTLVLEKSTKNTYRYQEVVAQGDELAFGSLYIQKSLVGEEPPAKLQVTVKATK